MKEYYDWDDGCYEKVTHSNELERNLHEVRDLCNIAREKNEESKRVPQDALEKAIEFIYGLMKEKETNGIELYEPDKKGWRYGAKKSRCSEKIEDEIVSIMIKYLENHDTYRLIELVVSAVATKEQEDRENTAHAER